MYTAERYTHTSNTILQPLKYKTTSGVETGGPGGTGPPPFCNAVSNENKMKNIAFLNSRLPTILCP